MPPCRSVKGHGQLTSREREILRHLVAGRTYREIGEALFISPKTVSTHVSHLLVKTGARSSAEVAGIARRVGLFTLPEDRPPPALGDQRKP